MASLSRSAESRNGQIWSDLSHEPDHPKQQLGARQPDPDAGRSQTHGHTGPSGPSRQPRNTCKATRGVGDDFDALVAELGKTGTTFEHYDLPDTTREDDIHVMGDMKAVSFKDPDGNILNLVTMQPAIVGAPG